MESDWVAKLKVVDLKKELHSRKLPVSGRKAELAKRLRESLSKESEKSTPVVPEKSTPVVPEKSTPVVSEKSKPISVVPEKSKPVSAVPEKQEEKKITTETIIQNIKNDVVSVSEEIKSNNVQNVTEEAQLKPNTILSSPNDDIKFDATALATEITEKKQEEEEMIIEENKNEEMNDTNQLENERNNISLENERNNISLENERNNISLENENIDIEIEKITEPNNEKMMMEPDKTKDEEEDLMVKMEEAEKLDTDEKTSELEHRFDLNLQGQQEEQEKDEEIIEEEEDQSKIQKQFFENIEPLNNEQLNQNIIYNETKATNQNKEQDMTKQQPSQKITTHNAEENIIKSTQNKFEPIIFNQINVSNYSNVPPPPPPPLPPLTQSSLPGTIGVGIAQPLQMTNLRDERETPVEEQTEALFIGNFVRPFTEKACREMLDSFGKVIDMWMPKIKTHCYIIYETKEEAFNALKATYDLEWPKGGRHLQPKFVSVDEARTEIENGKSGTNAKYNIQSQKQPYPPSSSRPSRFSYNPYLPQPPHPTSSYPTSSHPPSSHIPDMNRFPKRYPSYMRQEQLPPPTKSVNDLFIRTNTQPMLYFLPLTDEQVREREELEKESNNRENTEKRDIGEKDVKRRKIENV